jgi:hypothetical protein
VVADLDVDLGNAGILNVKTNNAGAYINAVAGNLTLNTVDVGNAAVQLSVDNGSLLNGAAPGTTNISFGSDSSLTANGGPTSSLGTDTTSLVIESSNTNVNLSLTASGQTNGVSGHFDATDIALSNVSFTGPGSLIFNTNILAPPPPTSGSSGGGATSASGSIANSFLTNTNGSPFLFSPIQNPASGNIREYTEEQQSSSPAVPQPDQITYLNPYYGTGNKYYRLAQVDSNRDDSKRLKPTTVKDATQQADDEEKKKKTKTSLKTSSR